jgi:serine/threonine protein kinase
MPIWKPNETIKNGRFLIEKTLGTGGFGITYLAQEITNGQQVVIKTLNANRQSAEDFREIQEKFVNEALKLSQFRHPYIVGVRELIQEGDLWGMVMEYIEGQELYDYVLDRKKLTQAEALNYISQIVQALDYVHQQGVLHRDVKPNNIMLRKGTREAILIDFGLAREFIDGKSLSMTNSLTQGYAPPEQYDRHGNFGAYTDVYALSATFYHMLTGQTPVPANFRQQPNVKLTEPKEYNSAIDDRVNHAIIQGMAMDAKQRPQTMAEFRKLLGLRQELITLYPIISESVLAPPAIVVSTSPVTPITSESSIASLETVSSPSPSTLHPVTSKLIVDYPETISSPSVSFQPAKKIALLREGSVVIISIFLIFLGIEVGKKNLNTFGQHSESCDRKTKNKDFQKVLANCNSVIELNPKSVDAYVNRGGIREKLKQEKEALSDYNKAIELDPGSSNAYVGRGSVKADNGQKKEALIDFNKAIELDSKNADAYVNRGIFKINSGQEKEALIDLSKAIELDSRNADAYVALGYAKVNSGQAKEALIDLSKAIELDSRNADAYIALGYARFNTGQTEALADFNKAIELDSENTNAYVGRGTLRANNEQKKEALADFNKAIELDSKNANAYVGRGTLRANNEQEKEALADFSKAIELDSENTDAYVSRAKVSGNSGQNKEALVDLNKAISLRPKRSDTYVVRGNLNEKIGQEKEALSDYNKAIELDPKNADAHWNRGTIRESLNQVKEALSDYDKAIELDPKNAQAYHYRATMRYNSGQKKEALSDYNKAIEYGFTHHEDYQNRGNINYDLGLSQEALSDYKKAQSIPYPNITKETDAREKQLQERIKELEKNILIIKPVKPL